MDTTAALIVATLGAATPLLLAAIGLLVNERSGVLNLGAEGMMSLAAVLGFIAGLQAGSITVGLLAGLLSGLVASLVFAVLAIGLAANQYATGLALTLFCGGLSAFIGRPYAGLPLTLPPPSAWPWLADLPVLGPVLSPALAPLSRLHPMVWLALLLTAAVAWGLARTRAGLDLRAVGESPEAARAIGLPVRRIRIAAVAFGGGCCGLAGAYLSLVHTPQWSEGMVAGRGWIALALTAFATWRPGRVVVGAWLFGGVTMLQFTLQAAGLPLAPQLLAMLPYLATIVVLVLMSRQPAFVRANMPASLGKPQDPS